MTLRSKRPFGGQCACVAAGQLTIERSWMFENRRRGNAEIALESSSSEGERQ